MKEPSITWFVRQDDDTEYQEDREYYAGTYNQDEDLVLNFMIWNNRYGSEACEDLKNFGITLSFDHEEDSVFLKYCQFLLNGNLWIVPQVVGNQATIQMPENIVLSGAINNGEATSADNYMTLRMIMTVPKSKNIKMNDLKGMTLYITSF